jgi:hypothetical protein
MHSPRWLIVFLALALAALACSINFSTTHFEDARLVTDATGDERARSYAPGDTFYCTVTLVDAEDGSTVHAAWIAVDADGTQRGSVVAETTLETGSGPLTLEAAPPDSGWPPGAYRLDLYVDSARKESIEFSVQ